MQGSLSWEINISRSQLTCAAGLRCLGTIRKGGCNLEYRGGKTAEGETLKVICMVAVLKKLLASIIFNWPGAQETGK